MSVSALCAGVSTVVVACGEPGMRRNGLRISFGVTNRNLYEEFYFSSVVGGNLPKYQSTGTSALIRWRTVFYTGLND